MRRLLPAFLLTLITLALASVAYAATLDSPAVQPVVAGRTSIKFRVAAGVSGAPAGFRVQWMLASEFDVIGGWPDAGYPGGAQGDFIGQPTLNITDGTTDYRLGSSGLAGVEIGDLFDETGIATSAVGELLQNNDYVIRVQALATADAPASAWSATARLTTASTALQNCTFTQGYWKNHTDVWPVGNLVIGGFNYTAAQVELVFNQPAAGNGMISLFHQLAAAKLNIAQGAVAPLAVQTAINNADALMTGLIAPPIGSGFLSPGSTSGLTNTLDDFNNGITGPGHCGTVGVKTSSWGVLKTRYR